LPLSPVAADATNYIVVVNLTSMSSASSDSRAERRFQLHVVKQRWLLVPAECFHCGRPLGLIYGSPFEALGHYVGGHHGKVTNFGVGPVEITCPGRRWGKRYIANRANFNAAYRAALAKPEVQRVLRLPYDLKTVARRKAAVRLDSPLIGR
jgi:hypothetical protein